MNRSICLILPGSIAKNIGGAEVQAFFIAKKCQEYGYTVFYLHNGTGENYTYNAIRSYQVPYQRWKPSWFYRMYLSISHLRPRICYQRVLGKMTGVAWILSLIFGAKFVWACSSDNDVCFETERRVSLKNERFITKIIGYGAGYFYDRLSYIAVKNADAVIVQTKYQQEQLALRYRINSTVIPNSVYLNNYKNSTPSSSVEKSIRVSWVANIKPLKQVEEFIKIAEVSKNLSCRFEIVGFDRKNMMEQVSLPVNITYLGGMSYSEIEKYFTEIDILVNTSKYEGFSNTFLQAWKNSVPVVSLNSDPDNIVTRYSLGFHSKSFEQLVADVHFLINNREERIRMGKNGLAYVIDNHNVDVNSKHIINIFNILLD